MSNTATLTVTVTAVNDAPVANNDTTTTNEDTPVTINVTTNDTDVDGTIDVTTVDLDPATIGIQTTFTVVGQGTYTVANTGVVTFTPVLNYNGVATPINYTVKDDLGLVSNTATLTVTVTAVNDAPVANNDTNSSIQSSAGDTAIKGLTATDLDGTIVSYTIVSLPLHGILRIGGVPVTTGIVLSPAQAVYLTYDPDGTFTGNDTFTFIATDNGGEVDATPATITIPVVNSVIVANNDDAGTIDGSKALSGIFNALANDTFNGLPLNAANVTVTFSASPNFTMTAAGLLNTVANIPGGTYTLTYSICEKANPNNCSTATITVFVSSPSIGLVKKANFNDENGDGYAQAGETITYTFEVKNKGNVPLSNITISDPLPGVTMTGAPLSLAVGETNTTQFKAVYVIKQTDINEGSISNQATVFGTAPNGRVVEDKSDDTDFDSDDATSLAISGCVIKVYNAVTPDGSGDYDKLVIRGLECYSDNSIQIFNRWGVLVFEREHYNNDDVVFKGFSEGRLTVERSQELPAGTYFYILKYRDSKSNAFEKSGYLYLNRK